MQEGTGSGEKLQWFATLSCRCFRIDLPTLKGKRHFSFSCLYEGKQDVYY